MTDRKVITEDGSTTYHSEKYDETYHSKSGALTEADKKYAEACGIDKLETADILDICFGLGYNTAAAIDRFKGSRIRVAGLEQNQGIVDEITRMGDEYPFKCREVMQEVAASREHKDEKVHVKIIMGDARKTIRTLKDKSFDLTFLDPFSPKRCPELWTEEFFRQIHRVLRKGGKIATYSCARAVRENFRKTGFHVKDGPVVGRRGPGTIAVKEN